MTFEELLDQVAMLQRRGRVAYRVVQRQFNLDDAVFCLAAAGRGGPGADGGTIDGL